MSLHFQLDLAFDFKDDTPIEIIAGLENLSNGISLSPEQVTHIPQLLESEKKGMTVENSFHGRSLFYFKKHHRYTKHMADVFRWTLHFRVMLSDDAFYEEGYALLAWFALHADTNGFIGYIKEEFDEHPRLLYVENNGIMMKEHSGKEVKFRYADFDKN